MLYNLETLLSNTKSKKIKKSYFFVVIYLFIYFVYVCIVFIKYKSKNIWYLPYLFNLPVVFLSAITCGCICDFKFRICCYKYLTSYRSFDCAFQHTNTSTSLLQLLIYKVLSFATSLLPCEMNELMNKHASLKKSWGT